MRKRHKYDNDKWSNCGHRFCTACLKRRGRNRGNRNERHRIKSLLHKLAASAG